MGHVIGRGQQEDDIRLKVFLQIFPKIDTPQSFVHQEKKHGYFIERVKALFPSQNDKTSPIW